MRGLDPKAYAYAAAAAVVVGVSGDKPDGTPAALGGRVLAKDAGGGVAIAWLNIGESGATLRLDGSGLNATGAEIWTLAPGSTVEGAVNPLQSREIKLNGKTLALGGGPSLPPLDGDPVAGSALTLPAARYGFAALPNAGAAACSA